MTHAGGAYFTCAHKLYLLLVIAQLDMLVRFDGVSRGKAIILAASFRQRVEKSRV